MARFFIHVDNGHGFIRDTDGIEFADLDAARRDAIRSGANIVAEELNAGCEAVYLTLYIDDHRGNRLMAIPVQASARILV